MEIQNLKRWTLPSSYMGATWEGYYSAGVGQSRDSDALERSNFRVMWKALQEAGSEAEIVRESHWAVGWIEWIAIKETDEAGLAVADDLKGKLEDYPILNESDYSELETEDANETWANCYSDQERIEYIRKYRRQFEFRNFADLIGCVRGKYFAGDSGQLLS